MSLVYYTLFKIVEKNRTKITHFLTYDNLLRVKLITLGIRDLRKEFNKV